MPGGAVAMPPGKQCNRCTKLFQPDELGSVAHLRSHIKVDKTPATPAELPNLQVPELPGVGVPPAVPYRPERPDACARPALQGLRRRPASAAARARAAAAAAPTFKLRAQATIHVAINLAKVVDAHAKGNVNACEDAMLTFQQAGEGARGRGGRARG